MNDVKILLEMKKKISMGVYDDTFEGSYDTQHKIEPTLIIPVNTLDKIILDALHMKEK